MSKISQGASAASPLFSAAKQAGELDKNLGRAPVIIVDEQYTMAQSKSIERYLARKLDMMGSSEEQAADIDAFSEHVRDIKDKYIKAKGEADKEVAVQRFFEETMPEMMGKLEKAVDTGTDRRGDRAGPVIGASLSLADVSLFVFLNDFFDDKAKALASIAQCRLLKASVKAVGEAPEIVQYRAARTSKTT